ncbi:unnamed protein product [Protopolystoma xenopodis]|uniref:Uncharacterized protein n=1 Tax=Protopolystoma xenopodis TaxID=117903 RepID=A0A3S5A585_9PLAT|nr:unnamed protein product [Protopolystoma xenopodis]
MSCRTAPVRCKLTVCSQKRQKIASNTTPTRTFQPSRRLLLSTTCRNLLIKHTSSHDGHKRKKVSVCLIQHLLGLTVTESPRPVTMCRHGGVTRIRAVVSAGTHFTEYPAPTAHYCNNSVSSIAQYCTFQFSLLT